MMETLVNREEVRIDEIGVKKLYVVNDGAGDIDMMLVSLMLPLYYRVDRVVCSSGEFRDVREAYHKGCIIEEVELEVVKGTLGDVIDDLYRVDATNRVFMSDMIFIVELESGEYVELDIGVINSIMWDDFVEVEEELEEEEEEDEWEEDVWDGVDVPEAEKEWL